MNKYRKKPIVIEAIQFKDNNWREVNEFLGFRYTDRPMTLFLDTLEGDMHVSLNDWIIRGIKGELYPCKPDIFEASYESVD